MGFKSGSDNLTDLDVDSGTLSVDEANDRIGVGTTSPTTNLDVDGSFRTGLVTLTETGAITAAAHAGRILLMGEVGGNAQAVFTLPAATGTGNVYKFIVSVVNTSNYVIQVPDASHVLRGQVVTLNDSTAGGVDSTISWPTAAQTDTITLNGTDTGGVSIGDYVELTDIMSNIYAVSGLLRASGTEATPFSAAV